MAPDIDAVTDLLVEERVWNTAKSFIEKYLKEHKVETRPASPTTSRKRSKIDQVNYVEADIRDDLNSEVKNLIL